jgi:hypothetical protein
MGLNAGEGGVNISHAAFKSGEGARGVLIDLVIGLRFE